jgi:hypothetical protein
MNKLISTLTLIVFSICAKAQTEKGTVYLGGMATWDHSKNESLNFTSSYNRLSLAPTIGVFVAKNLSIGLTPQYEYGKDKSEYANTVSNYYNQSNLLGGGLDLRYYWTIISKLSFFTQLSGSYLTSVGSNNSYDIKQFNANITPNFAFFATKKLAFIFRYGILAYTHQKREGQDGVTTSNNFGVNANAGFGLGLNYHFTK